MKKFFIIIAVCFPLMSFSQWNYHHSFFIPTYDPWDYYHAVYNDAIFISSDTGYYCYTVENSSPSSHANNEFYLKKTTNDCVLWNTDFGVSFTGVHGIALKYFKPYTFFIFWYGGVWFLWKKGNSSWDALSTPYNCEGYYDFFAKDTANYCILYPENRKLLQSIYRNDEVRIDTFNTYKPRKIFFPRDTVEVLLSLAEQSTGYNTIILKFTPSTGYNVVYEDPSQQLSNLHFPSENVGYVVGNNGLVLRTNDLGSSWVTLNTGFSSKLNSVFFINDSTGYVAGNAGLILKTTNYGFSWQKQTTQTNLDIGKLFFVNDSVGFFLVDRYLNIIENTFL